MKKIVIKIICFVIIFSCLFMMIQNVLHYRWLGHEALYTRNLDYANQPEGSIDVICFGTSEIYAAYDPIVTYYEAGITGYNFAISWRSAVTVYYQLLYALKYQTPSVVLCDFSSLYDNQLPGEVERLYRKVVDCMPDRTVKNQLINTICELDPSQSYLSWKYPLLRYHSMWSELTEENFMEDYIYDEEYPLYAKGALLSTDYYDGDVFEISPDLWGYSEAETNFSNISVKYYDMFIEECQNRGIKVVAVLPPKLNAASQYASRWEAMKEYFDSRDVSYLNYNTYDQVIRLNVTLEADYYDSAHLNIYGSIKFSKILAQDLRTEFDLMDHRDDAEYVDEWQTPLALFLDNFILH